MLRRMVTRMGFFLRWVATLGLLGAAVVACSGDEETGSDDSADSGNGGTTGGSANGGSATGGTGAGPSDPALAAFCADVRANQVGFLERCAGVAREIAEVYVTVDPCAVWGPAVDSARMLFDSAADRNACLAALQAMPCDIDADELPAACSSVLSGLRTIGETCSFAANATRFSECEIGTVCVGELLGSTISCEGTCVRRSLLNEPCSGSQPCQVGQTCTVNGTCAPKGGPGAACGLSSSPECIEGYHCSDTFADGTCVAHLPLGAECTGAALECAPPAYCNRGGNITGTCDTLPKPGDACVVDDFECDDGFSYCGADGTCHALAKLGEPCENMDGEGTYCWIGTCDETLATPTCKAAAPGEYCSADADCQPGSLCQTAFNGMLVQQCTPKCF